MGWIHIRKNLIISNIFKFSITFCGFSVLRNIDVLNPETIEGWEPTEIAELKKLLCKNCLRAYEASKTIKHLEEIMKK